MKMALISQAILEKVFENKGMYMYNSPGTVANKTPPSKVELFFIYSHINILSIWPFAIFYYKMTL